MAIEDTLNQRCGGKCELCTSTTELSAHLVATGPDDLQVNDAERSVMICDTCQGQINAPETTAPNHWRCLNDSMWSQVPAVQVMAWRMLNRLKGEGWPIDLLDAMYLEGDVLKWAQAGLDQNDDEPATVDSNGTALNDGDTVTLIKDLVVKGAGFTAKRGTTVKNISLSSNPLHVEGRVNGTAIVLVAAYLKKTA